MAEVSLLSFGTIFMVYSKLFICRWMWRVGAEEIFLWPRSGFSWGEAIFLWAERLGPLSKELLFGDQEGH